LSVTITSLDYSTGYVWGMIEKKIISIQGKKEQITSYFEGQIIDGVNHTFTSNTTSNCDVLDVYFWNRFPSFKDITSMNDIRKMNSDYLYMRWHEKGEVKQRRCLSKK
jgi:hypothetical protein